MVAIDGEQTVEIGLSRGGQVRIADDVLQGEARGTPGKMRNPVLIHGGASLNTAVRRGLASGKERFRTGHVRVLAAAPRDAQLR